jgi:hypothetical protein
MNATKKYWLVLSALLLGSCSCGTMSPLSFLNTHNQTVKIGKNKFVFYDIPDGYNKDTIHVNNAGSDYEIIIPYKDSAFLYYHRDPQMCLNKENIKKIHSVESGWRMHYRHLLAEKNDGLHEYHKEIIYSPCGCTWYEVLEYDMPDILDMRGTNGNQIWRDVLICKEFCIGYIVRDSSMLEPFDKCIEATICKIKKKKKLHND